MEHETIQEHLQQTRVKLEGRFAEFEKSLRDELSSLTKVKHTALAAPTGGGVMADVERPRQYTVAAGDDISNLTETIKRLQEQNRVMAGTAGRLNKDLEAQENKNRDLQSVVQKLEEKIKAGEPSSKDASQSAGSPDPELLKRIGTLQEQLLKAEASTAEYLREIETKNVQLKEQLDLLARIRSKRDQELKGARDSVQSDLEALRTQNEDLQKALAIRRDKNRRAAQFWRRWVAYYRSQKRFIMEKKWG